VSEHTEQVEQYVGARLAALDSLPVDEHVAIYDALHRELLDQLVEGPVDASAPRP
jgi:hypothetical protein